MNPAHREMVERAFAAALAAREDANAGAASATISLDLIGLCDGDEAVRREVQSLLRHFEAAGDDHDPGDDNADAKPFLNPVELHGSRGLGVAFGQDAVLRDWGGEAIGQRVDGFTIIGKLGEGGMGVVYVAEQENPRRTVALKVVRRGVATASTVRRFEREAQL